MSKNAPLKEGWRRRWFVIIFESDTKAGKEFDVALLIAIASSLIVVMLETVKPIAKEYRPLFIGLEWFFTIIFSVEYVVRMIVVRKPRHYILSFYGLVDLISVLPSYLALVLGGAQYFMVIRSLRLMRVFRVLKMVRFIGEARVLSDALKASRPKIIVFIIGMVCATFILGTMMYLIEGPSNGFKSIPMAIYWCIVTLTTVGYGDISPQTPLGQILASVIMILGYGIIAVPTGIVTSELARKSSSASNNKSCPHCGEKELPEPAHFCHQCGQGL